MSHILTRRRLMLSAACALLPLVATAEEPRDWFADTAQGLATMRADMTAFFVVGAVCMMVGAWRRNGDLLLVPAGLFGVALLGRFVGLASDGPWEGYWMPMLVEGAMVILLLIASRVLPHRVG